MAPDPSSGAPDPAFPGARSPSAGSAYTRHRFALIGVLVALLVVGGSAVALATTGRPAASDPGLTASVRHRLLAEAQTLVGGRDDSAGRPWTASVVYTTRARLAAATRDDNWGTGPFWVVQVRGTFVCGRCSGPAGRTQTGVKAPTNGAAYYFPSDPGTGVASGFGFGRPIDLTSLGHVHRLR